jgi:CDP-6-deoxy-D-xylo-4-hexulose-3-dehydrase
MGKNTKSNFKWPLNVNNFTFWERLILAKFILNKNAQWTRGKLVSLFEEKMARFVGSKYAIFVSSGSTANTLLAMYLRDFATAEKNTIVFPSTTWTTSISPFIREGFEPKFLDISLEDWSLDLKSLDNYLKENHSKVACVFVTSLLGFTPNVEKLKELEIKYNVKIMMDNCENTFGKYKDKNVSSYFTSTTSTYFGHQMQTIEGGFVFTNDKDEYNYFLMLMNHGMVRSLPEKDRKNFKNTKVHPQFDFYCLGNNFRNNNFNARLGLIELNRLDYIISNRRSLYETFKNLTKDFLIFPQDRSNTFDVPFSIPVVCSTIKKKKAFLKYCEENSIETRPIISGNLLKQTAYKKFDDSKIFSDSNILDVYGFYVGLFPSLPEKEVVKLAESFKEINKTT